MGTDMVARSLLMALTALVSALVWYFAHRHGFALPTLPGSSTGPVTSTLPSLPVRP